MQLKEDPGAAWPSDGGGGLPPMEARGVFEVSLVWIELSLGCALYTGF